jgi:hypothetical protein
MIDPEIKAPPVDLVGQDTEAVSVIADTNTEAA